MIRGRSTARPIYQRAPASDESYLPAGKGGDPLGTPRGRGRVLEPSSRPIVTPSSYDAAMATTDTPDTATGAARGLGVELNGINTIAETERQGKPRDLFWPWFAANVSVLGISYGAFLLGFGDLLLAGHRGRPGRHRGLVPALRRGLAGRQARLGADHGAQPGRVRRARQPAAVRAVLAAHRRLGDRAGRRWPRWPPPPCSTGSAGAAATGTKSSPWSSSPALIVAGRRRSASTLIMRLQTVITIVTGVLTVVYIILVARPDRPGRPSPRCPPGSARQVIGGAACS